MKKLTALLLCAMLILSLIPVSAFADGDDPTPPEFAAFDDIVLQGVTFYDIGKTTNSMYQSYQKGPATFYQEYFSAKGADNMSLMELWAAIADALFDKAHSNQPVFLGHYENYQLGLHSAAPVDHVSGIGTADNVLAAAVAAREAIDVHIHGAPRRTILHTNPLKEDGIPDNPNMAVYYYKGNRFNVSDPAEGAHAADGSYVIIFSDLTEEVGVYDQYLCEQDNEPDEEKLARLLKHLETIDKRYCDIVTMKIAGVEMDEIFEKLQLKSSRGYQVVDECEYR